MHCEFLIQVPSGHGRNDFHNPAHLVREVVSHHVHVIREVLPRAGDALHLRLAAELTFRADLSRHARHFRGKRVELVHHHVDGVLQFQDFTFNIYRDLLGQIALGDRCCHLSNISHLGREITGHHVHGVGEVLPRARNTRHNRLPAELAVGADFARDTRHL